MRVRISWKSGEAYGFLNDSITARKVSAVLPCSSTVNTWGDEVYFSLPVEAQLEAEAQQTVPAGTICFWVQGNSMAIPFGPTPISRGSECRLVTKVNLLGQLENDARVLRSLRDGDQIRIEAV